MNNNQKIEQQISDRRESFRVVLKKGAAVTLNLPDQVICIEEISAGGLSYTEQGSVAGQILHGSLILPGYEGQLNVTVQVLRVSHSGIVHCGFMELTEDDEDNLHYFVLCHQKNQLNKEKKKSGFILI
jgi:hypothetical protein